VTSPRLAREWLEAEIAELAGLRNAGSRAPEFKAWRQNTLTVIQRIWPGDDKRSDRFRRIPFRPVGVSRPDRNLVRDAFERGCGEAGVLLRTLVGEVVVVGIEPSDESTFAQETGGAPRLEPTWAKPTEPEETVMPPGEPAAELEPEPVPEPEPEPAPPNPAVTQWLDRLPKSGGRRSQAPDSNEPTRRPRSSPEQWSPGPKSAEAPRNAPKNAPRSHEPPPPGSRITEALKRAPKFSEAMKHPPKPGVRPRDDHEEVARVSSDFLSASPVFGTRNPEPESGAPSTDAAREMLSIAASLADLGVPTGRQRLLSTALRDLAETLDSGAIDWLQLRDATHLVMEHPAVARRAMPHLLPLIQSAA
jgi:hypothetical protein